MKTQDLTYAQLWREHYADPENIAVRREIITRDGGYQVANLWPSKHSPLVSVPDIDTDALEDATRDAKASLDSLQKLLPL